MSLPTYEAVRDAFAEVLNLKIEPDKRNAYVDNIIRILDPNIFHKLLDKGIIFDILDKFTPIKITESGKIKEKRGIFRRNISINRINTNIGSGSYGTVYKTIGENVFKEIYLNITKPIELYEILLELFIPTILGLHPVHGQYISNPIKVYYDNTNNNIYIQIKPLKYDMIKYINSKTIGGQKLSKDVFFRPIKYISYLLKTFKDDYNFYHNDLHVGNIMFDEFDNPQLIDFGMSCLTFDGVTYSSEQKKICKSYDMLIFITSLLEQEKKRRSEKKQPQFSDELYTILVHSYDVMKTEENQISDELYTILVELYKIMIGEEEFPPINIYIILKFISAMNANSPIFHGAYYDALAQINKYFITKFKTNILNIINISNYGTIESFIHFINSNWKGIEHSGYTGMHGSRNLLRGMLPPPEIPTTAGGKRSYSKTYKKKHTNKSRTNKNRKHK